MAFTRISRIISSLKLSQNIISISEIFNPNIEYRIVSDNWLIKLSIIVSFAKSSLGYHWLGVTFESQG